MTITLNQVMMDARRLLYKLKEGDTTADTLLSKSHNALKLLEGMKQYSEEVAQLNKVARHRPHTLFVANIQQESKRLRELQKENKEMRDALNDYHLTLEMIMSRYRLQVSALVNQSSADGMQILKNQAFTEILNLTNRVSEMADVMRAAAKAEEEDELRSTELITQLLIENQGLRELLNISRKIPCGSLEASQDKQLSEKSDNDVAKQSPAELLEKFRKEFGCALDMFEKKQPVEQDKLHDKQLPPEEPEMPCKRVGNRLEMSENIDNLDVPDIDQLTPGLFSEEALN